MLTGAEIIRGLKKSDKKSLDIAYENYNQKIFGFAMSYLKIKDEAEDIVHEVFLKIWEKRTSLRNEGNFESFLFTITRNIILSHFRKKASEKEYLNYIGKLTTKNSLGTEEVSNFNFLEEKVNYHISQLSPKRQEVFILSRKEGLSYKEIAKKLKISEKTVEDHISKSLTTLRTNMDHYGLVAQLFIYMFW